MGINSENMTNSEQVTGIKTIESFNYVNSRWSLLRYSHYSKFYPMFDYYDKKHYLLISI